MNANATSVLEGPRVTNWATAELPVDWRSHMRSRGLLVVLIHGTWCHACLEQLVWLRRRHVWLTDLGVGSLAVAVDDPSNVAAFNSSLWTPLPFTLAPDEGAALSRALGLYDEAAQATRSAFMLIDCSGIVRFAQIDQHTVPEQSLLIQEIERLPVC